MRLMDSGDMMEMLTGTAVRGLNILGSLFLFIIGALAAVALVFFIVDVTQTKDAIRRNYPVIGRFRGLFSQLGEFFRQYFFAMDREEMPFNRAERDWINESTHEGSETVPFGSTKRLSPGTAIFANGLFPKLDGEWKAAAILFFKWALQSLAFAMMTPRLTLKSSLSFAKIHKLK